MQKHASTEKSQLQASIVTLEKGLEGSLSAAKELRSNLAVQKITLVRFSTSPNHPKSWLIVL